MVYLPINVSELVVFCVPVHHKNVTLIFGVKFKLCHFINNGIFVHKCIVALIFCMPVYHKNVTLIFGVKCWLLKSSQ